MTPSGNRLVLIISVVIFLFGIFITIEEPVLYGLLYAIPLLSLLSKRPFVRTVAVWLGVFLVLQSVISPFVPASKFATLEPNRIDRFNITTPTGSVGLQGPQVLTTDSMGFRSTKKINYYDKHPNTFRIFTIGASTTQQIFVSDVSTWTHLLQTALDRISHYSVEVINTGVPGTILPNQFATLTQIRKFKPDLVIFLLGVNDWNKQIVIDQVSFIRKLGIFKEPLAFRHSLLYRFCKSVTNHVLSRSSDSGEKPADFHSMTVAFMADQRDSLNRKDKRSFHPKQVWSRYARTLDAIGEYCKKYNIDCLFMTQPTAYRPETSAAFKKEFWMTPMNETFTVSFDDMVHISQLYNRYLIDWANENGFPVLDLASQLPTGYASFFDDCHFNINGCKLVKHHLFTFLTQRRPDLIRPLLPEIN